MQKEKGCKIIIDFLSLGTERDLQRVPTYEDRMASDEVWWLWLEVRDSGRYKEVEALQEL
jgi:hypothetical protein